MAASALSSKLMTAPAPHHVLLVRTDRLGDMLLTLPMVHALKVAYPACRVTVLASEANIEAARHHPEVDGVELDAVEAKGSGLRGVRRLAAQLRGLGCDAAVMVHPTPRLALAVCLAGVPIRIGTAYRVYSFLFNRRIHEHRSRPPWKHEAVHNLNLLRPLGVSATEVSPVRWQVSAEEAADIDRLLQDAGVCETKLVVIHPGNAGSALNWSASQYGELARRLAADGVRVLLTGSAGEAGLTARVAAAAGPGAIDLAGKLTLAQLAALLSRCRLYVGSSTGPTHLAAAVGTPVLALYSPLRSNAPARWAPLGRQVAVLQPQVALVCPRCLGPRCPYYHCMETHLSVQQAQSAARQLLDAVNESGPV